MRTIVKEHSPEWMDEYYERKAEEQRERKLEEEVERKGAKNEDNH